MSEISDTQAALNAGKLLASPIARPGCPDLIRVPSGESILSLEPYLPAPVRKKGQFSFDNITSFCDYIAEHQAPQSRVFFSKRQNQFVAILDFHGETPAWGQHRAVLTPEKSEAWKAWTGKSGTFLPQKDFAFFIEDNIEDFKNPSGAAMLDIARHIEGTTNATFGEAIRLDNGDVQVAYKVESGVKAGQKKDLDIPTSFILSIPVFSGEQDEEVEVRLRHRVDEGKIAFKYEILKPQKIADNAIDGMIDIVNTKLKTKVFYGTPA